MGTKLCSVATFLQATRGNWRNAIYIECRNCIYGKHELCCGFLLTFDADATPLIIRAKHITDALGDVPAKDECVAVLNRYSFEALFAPELAWKIASPQECALFKLTEPPRNTC